MKRALGAILFILLLQNSFAQNKQEEKEWRKVYWHLNTLEIPDVRIAYVSDVKALEVFLQKYPEHGMALHFLKGLLFNLLYWGQSYDSSYSPKYLDILNRYINLPAEIENGCSDTKLCKMMALQNRGEVYFRLGDTTSACKDYMLYYNYLLNDTGSTSKKFRVDPYTIKKINLCKGFK